ncbi:hypothetical protein EV356DRAFT_507032 [Viridothelium virens]|uniref:Uncharacterized protein n=1 Tax=Viridothelium virens TaxID=1048519 RepID=A0A6A6H0M9_VIRVR|nr:hypothetical protein EV356DRAFT_507032 [Viridothelium virens]
MISMVSAVTTPSPRPSGSAIRSISSISNPPSKTPSKGKGPSRPRNSVLSRSNTASPSPSLHSPSYDTTLISALIAAGPPALTSALI